MQKLEEGSGWRGVPEVHRRGTGLRHTRRIAAAVTVVLCCRFRAASSYHSKLQPSGPRRGPP